MSIPAGLEELAAKVSQFGSSAYLVSVNPDGSPHLVSVRPEWDDEANLVAVVGARSWANARDRLHVSLLWPAPPGEPYSLIVDGVVTNTEESNPASALEIEPRAAVLHLTADGDPSLPSCVRIMTSH